MPEFAGKVALVTGGGRGMGAAIARRLASGGASLAITYSASAGRAEALVEDLLAKGQPAMALRADNRDARAISAAVEAVVEAYGQIDILVNNAGIFETGLVPELDEADFDRTVDINVKAVVLATRSVAPHMPDGGRIVIIGSNLAQRVPWPGISLYALSKAALIGFTRGAARDFGSRGITVNIVHPGATDTEMNPSDGETADAQRAAMALGRYGDPAEVAGLVAWLAGPEGRGVTGAEFTIDGGTNA